MEMVDIKEDNNYNNNTVNHTIIDEKEITELDNVQTVNSGISNKNGNRETNLLESIKNKDIIQWLCLSGIFSIVFYLLHDIIGARHYPGYDWKSQAVSDLTATNSPSFVYAHQYSSVNAVLTCVSCTTLFTLVKRETSFIFRLGIYLFSTMHYVSAVGYSLFPLSDSGYDGSAQSFIHVYIVTILVVLLSIVSLILIAVGSLRGKNKHRVVGILAIVALILMFVGAVGSGNVPKKCFGIFERFSTYSAVAYTSVLSIYGFFL